MGAVLIFNLKTVILTMEIQLILTVIIVKFGSTSADDGVHSNNRIMNKKETVANGMNEGVGIQRDFFNLVDSIVNRDKKKTETYRDILKQEAGSEQQIFDLMKTNIRSARQRDAPKQEYFRKEVAVFKRQTNHKFFRRALLGITDYRFIAMYGNDVNTSGLWQRARELASDSDKLKNISYEAHMAVWPYDRKGVVIDKAYVTNEILMFPGTNFTDMRVDLIGYQLVGVPKVTFYLTKGLRSGCLLYVWKIRRAGPKWELKNEISSLNWRGQPMMYDQSVRYPFDYKMMEANNGNHDERLDILSGIALTGEAAERGYNFIVARKPMPLKELFRAFIKLKNGPISNIR